MRPLPFCRRYALIALLVTAVCTFGACTSEPSPFPPSIDYTDGRSVLREIDATRVRIAEEPLEALLRAHRLKLYTEHSGDIDALYQEAEAAAEKALEAAAADGKWDAALRISRSLAVLGKQPVQWSEETLAAAQREAWKEKGFSALVQSASGPLPDASAEAPSIETVRKMMKGVVTVWVDRGITIEKGLGRADRMIGSGFFIDKNGFLITNYHVIQSEVDPEYEGFSRVYVKPAGNTSVRIPAKVIGWDPIFDLALLKTEITPEVSFVLGSSEDLNLGSRIYAIGSPAGLEQTLTSGIVSAKDRRFLSLGSVLQIDAPVNHGSSGGPIIDEAGRVQAIVFAGLERQEGLNFAIPVELLKLILSQLYGGGAAVHAWMASYGLSVPEAIGQRGGAKLVYTLPGASASCIPAGTLITRINDRPVADLEALQAELMRFSAGTIVKISGYAPPQTDAPDIEAASGVSVGTIPASVEGTAPGGATDRTSAADTVSGSGSSPAADGVAFGVSGSSFVGGVADGAQLQDWYVQLEARPEEPGEQVYRKERRARAMLPLYGMYLESAGGKKSFRITDVIPGSYADEAGFSAGDYLEIRTMELQKDQDAVYTQIYTKRRKSAYLDTFMDLWSYIDNPAYF